MSGLAALTLPDANFHHGRIESASGSLVVNRGGQISRSFFDAMVAHLRMPGQRPPGSSGPLEYLQFGLGFNLNPGGLELKGLCHTDNGNAILTDGDQLLLLEAGQAGSSREPRKDIGSTFCRSGARHARGRMAPPLAAHFASRKRRRICRGGRQGNAS